MSSEQEGIDRILSGQPRPEDHEILGLRPRTLAEYIGQVAVKERLSIYVEAARRRGEALDHVLLYGPPGLGKTTLAYIIAHEMGVPIETTSGPALERPGDIASILTNLTESGVLFVDEIHRLNKVAEEKLYPALEDFRIDLIVGQGPGARIIPLGLEPFTLVGATTRIGSLTGPMRDRFGVVLRLDYYSPQELATILERSARILKVDLRPQGCEEIARRSRGTPRIANRLLKRVRDYSEVRGEGIIDRAIADAALSMMEIDRLGLDPMDRRLLEAILLRFGGGPVGLDTLAACLSESAETIEDVYEPFLLQLGFLDRTPRGRRATLAAARHLGIESSDQDAPLFR